jgi:hypothetical protein
VEQRLVCRSAEEDRVKQATVREQDAMINRLASDMSGMTDRTVQGMYGVGRRAATNLFALTPLSNSWA